jgi:hypothetical protein
MQRNESQIVDYFRQFIHGFIFNDIENCIKCRANYVVALALLSYTEYLGGLISGNLGLNKSKQSFEKALQFFPKKYKELDSSLTVQYTDEKGVLRIEHGIYTLLRCGMVHEYFPKGMVTIYNDPSGQERKHIGILKKEYQTKFHESLAMEPYSNKVIEFHTNEYFRDFKAAVNRILNGLILDKNGDLLTGFNNSLDRIYSRTIS